MAEQLSSAAGAKRAAEEGDGDGKRAKGLTGATEDDMVSHLDQPWGFVFVYVPIRAKTSQ